MCVPEPWAVTVSIAWGERAPTAGWEDAGAHGELPAWPTAEGHLDSTRELLDRRDRSFAAVAEGRDEALSKFNPLWALQD
jgi:hypothetical protein